MTGYRGDRGMFVEGVDEGIHDVDHAEAKVLGVTWLRCYSVQWL